MSADKVTLRLGDTLSENLHLVVTPDACHWCRTSFAAGQTRFLIMDGVGFGCGWERVSLCMACFKHPDCSSSYRLSGAERYNRACAGCAEPICTIFGRGTRWLTCSQRCYLRAYRKLRRANGGASAIDWKGKTSSCEACKKAMKSKRADARFCSDACRQWCYRRCKAWVP